MGRRRGEGAEGRKGGGAEGRRSGCKRNDNHLLVITQRPRIIRHRKQNLLRTSRFTLRHGHPHDLIRPFGFTGPFEIRSPYGKLTITDHVQTRTVKFQRGHVFPIDLEGEIARQPSVLFVVRDLTECC